MGDLPVVFSGERNCWPFPHGDSPLLAQIPEDALLSGGHHGSVRYGYGHKSPWYIKGRDVCHRWLLEFGSEARFPFLCAGTFVGTRKTAMAGGHGSQPWSHSII